MFENNQMIRIDDLTFPLQFFMISRSGKHIFLKPLGGDMVIYRKSVRHIRLKSIPLTMETNMLNTSDFGNMNQTLFADITF